MDVNELALKTVEAMLAYGLKPYTAWHEHSHAHSQIIKLHEEIGQRHFNRKIVTAYVQSLEERFENGDITIRYYRKLKRGAQRLTEMHDTGKLEWTAPQKTSRFVLNPYYEKILSKAVAARISAQRQKVT